MPIQKTDKELCFDSLDYHKTLQGDYKVLEQALQLVDSATYNESINYEQHPAVLTLCNWYNIITMPIKCKNKCEAVKDSSLNWFGK
jgi:hypothetical protein